MTVSVLIDFSAATTNSTRQHWSASNPSEVLVAKFVDEVKALIDAAWQASINGKHCVMFLRYEAASAFDQAFTTKTGDGPLAWAAIFDRVDNNWPALDRASSYAPMRWTSDQTRESFDSRIAKIHSAIEAGDTYQINYTDAVSSAFEGDPRALFEALHRAQPQSYSAFIDTGEEQILSVSPELFFDWRVVDGEHRIVSRPMKGTATRGSDAAEDEAQSNYLRESVKERAENLMIVDLIRNDVSRIAKPFSVKVPALFQTQAWPTVWQMTSDVSAVTREGTTLADVISALFPCGSITGVPKVRAMQLIDDLEPAPRGIYCGAIGVLAPGGSATFNVAIRTVNVRGKEAKCGIGSGITIDATAPGEWQEWINKRAFLDRAAMPFDLLQTLRLENGVFADAALHMERMARAAAHFGYPWSNDKVQEALLQTATSHAIGEWRVRLLGHSNGEVTTQAFAFSSAPMESAVVRLAARFMPETHSDFTLHKTTRRTHYDLFAPTEAGVFDTLLYNARDELTEFTRGTVAMLLDGEWVTPPLSCGLLDGVGRARALETGRVKEKVVRVDDLSRVEELVFLNGLRGWIPVELKAAAEPVTSGSLT